MCDILAGCLRVIPSLINTLLSQFISPSPSSPWSFKLYEHSARHLRVPVWLHASVLLSTASLYHRHSQHGRQILGDRKIRSVVSHTVGTGRSESSKFGGAAFFPYYEKNRSSFIFISSADLRVQSKNGMFQQICRAAVGVEGLPPCLGKTYHYTRLLLINVWHMRRESQGKPEMGLDI